ncbi:MAG: helix-turn-helix transcriptional regulator [Lautropia sp.]|nr:helix-turn-helix transcriptional regulator [Lautropia sp.]
MTRIPDPILTTAQLGAILQAERKAKVLTQAALAARIGLSQSRVSHLEQNAHELSAQQLLAWCAVLDLELSLGRRGSASVSTNLAEW